jgi:phosphoglycolate phosphatase
MERTGPVGFDLDMTLIDSRPAIMASWRAVSAETGVRIDLDQVDIRMGIKLEEEVTYWFPPADRENAAACYRRHYTVLAPGLTTLLPGAEGALTAVQQSGERAVVVTAKHAISVGPSLGAVGLAPDEVFTHVHGPQKAEVLIRLGAAAYVGDTPADMRAGRDAGAVAIGVPTGSFSAGQLTAAGADLVLASLLEFPPWYAGFRGRPAGAATTEGIATDGD